MNLPNVLSDDDGIRPAGKPDQCFYCFQTVGTPHGNECVAVHKVVRLRAAVEGHADVEYDQEVPYSWDDDMILFRFNESSWCADNLLGLAVFSKEFVEEARRTTGCLCGKTEVSILGVVTPGPYVKQWKKGL